MKIKILPSASNDLVEGFGFYEKQSNGLGDSLFAVYYKIKKNTVEVCAVDCRSDPILAKNKLN